MTPKAWATTKQINKLDFIKINFPGSEDKPQDRKKKFANHMYDKEFVSRIYKRLLQLNNIKTPTEKLSKELTRHFYKENMQYQKKLEGFPGGAVVENLPANAGDTGSSPGLGRSHMPWSN